MNGTSFQSDIRYWLRQGNTVNHLLFWNIVVFVVLGLLYLIAYFGGPGTIFSFTFDQLVLHSELGTFIRKPWGLVTYMFTHLNIFHIFFNMLNLYWFGNLFRTFLGNKRILPLYLLGGIAGGLLYILTFYILMPAGVGLPLLGASASVMCLLVACATLTPNYEIGLLLLGSVRLKWLALAVIVLDLISIPQGNMGGMIAHLGGAALGFIYIKLLKNGADLCQPLIWVFDALSGGRNGSTVSAAPKSRRTSFKPKKSPLKVVKKVEENRQSRLDQLLDKINEKGISSLSPEEKAWLDKHSRD
ncbi:rhomboid family intramembrane serine protease [Chitinophaga agrisoli]|uniref:Rhomboid family intramembrane serine protease n=1 Tax=Chitinophaga agrisoli TaxID=2607653 RepID=A0A5B2VN97_9BACT|nr:rhomboid family intramembrane serine protease [Chitinophaga agrisoli]KAA2240244.1 rhomboid family intramembrane serine protease [Chitinophaga agrisoli]